jgi:hypothetical protein
MGVVMSQFKLGHCWTRGGSHAEIFEIDDVIFGKYLVRDGDWRSGSWLLSGKSVETEDHDLDLVSNNVTKEEIVAALKASLNCLKYRPVENHFAIVMIESVLKRISNNAF